VSAYVLLEDGTRFDGDAVGAEGHAVGEVVFTTGMAGYQESVTDPSFAGQLITFTYPHIGNYGVSAEAMESDRIHAARRSCARRATARTPRAPRAAGWTGCATAASRRSPASTPRARAAHPQRRAR
jgi:carbamoyl-phosphate synthase small subunit